MDAERAGFFFVEGAKAGVVDRAGFAQANVPLDNLDDIGLLLHVLGKVGHSVMGSVLRILTAATASYGGKLEKELSYLPESSIKPESQFRTIDSK